MRESRCLASFLYFETFASCPSSASPFARSLKMRSRWGSPSNSLVFCMISKSMVWRVSSAAISSRSTCMEGPFPLSYTGISRSRSHASPRCSVDCTRQIIPFLTGNPLVPTEVAQTEKKPEHQGIYTFACRPTAQCGGGSGGRFAERRALFPRRTRSRRRTPWRRGSGVPSQGARLRQA